MKNVFSILFLFLSFISKLSAQTGEEELYKKYDKVNNELNVVYNKLKNKLENADKAALVQSEKTWLQFREANCKFISKSDSEGGVIANKMKLSCMIQTTTARIKELESLIEEF
jgi:uncharacterized protein YecT (DUF1311 family)